MFGRCREVRPHRGRLRHGEVRVHPRCCTTAKPRQTLANVESDPSEILGVFKQSESDRHDASVQKPSDIVGRGLRFKINIYLLAKQLRHL